MKQQRQKTGRYLAVLGLLTAVAVGAFSFSTYAWFVANRQVTGSIGDISANALGNLEVKIDPSDSDDTPWDDTFKYTMAPAEALTDISGDGKTFFKPVISVNDATKFAKVNQVKTANGYYYDIEVSFRSTAQLTVYLGQDTEIKVAGTGVNGYEKALRLAFLDKTKSTVTNIFTEETDELWYLNDKDLAVDTTPDLAKGYGQFGADVNVMKGAVVNRVLNDDASEGDLTNKSAPLVLLGGVDGSVTEEVAGQTYYTGAIIVRYWIEGTDANCITDNIAEKLSVTLNFYGLEPDNI